MTKREKIILRVLEAPIGILIVVFFVLMFTGGSPEAVSVVYCIGIGYCVITGLIIGVVDLFKLKREEIKSNE